MHNISTRIDPYCMKWYNNTFQEESGKSLSHSHAQRVHEMLPRYISNQQCASNTCAQKCIRELLISLAAFHFISFYFFKLLQDTTWLNRSMWRKSGFCFFLENNDNAYFIHAGKWLLYVWNDCWMLMIMMVFPQNSNTFASHLKYG